MANNFVINLTQLFYLLAVDSNLAILLTGADEPSVNDHPFFERFHSELIDKHFDEGVVQIIRVRAGSTTIGALYNFLHDKTVSVYQTGFNYSHVQSPNKESPGLLTHAMAIERNCRLGYRRYDLLAGDSQYKKALSNSSEELWWGHIQRCRFRFYIEKKLQYMWRRLHDYRN